MIIQAGEAPSQNLYVIMNGSVRVTLPRPSGEELLIDVRGEGDTFGALSLLQGEQALFSVTAQEDLLAFMLLRPSPSRRWSGTIRYSSGTSASPWPATLTRCAGRPTATPPR